VSASEILTELLKKIPQRLLDRLLIRGLGGGKN